jgi:hypothetical protein
MAQLIKLSVALVATNCVASGVSLARLSEFVPFGTLAKKRPKVSSAVQIAVLQYAIECHLQRRRLSAATAYIVAYEKA